MSTVTPGTRQPPLRPAGPIIFVLLCAALGCGFLYWAASQLWSVQVSKNWPTTQGTILHSSYIDLGRRRGGRADIRYSYSVNWRIYMGTNLLPGAAEYIDRDEKQKVQAYRPGMRVPVYYDPANPQASALEVGVITRLPFIGLALSLLFLGGAGRIGWALLRGQPPAL